MIVWLQTQVGRPNNKPRFSGLFWQIANEDPQILVSYLTVLPVVIFMKENKNFNYFFKKIYFSNKNK